jgi:hypothetical protein
MSLAFFSQPVDWVILEPGSKCSSQNQLDHAAELSLYQIYLDFQRVQTLLWKWNFRSMFEKCLCKFVLDHLQYLDVPKGDIIKIVIIERNGRSDTGLDSE